MKAYDCHFCEHEIGTQSHKLIYILSICVFITQINPYHRPSAKELLTLYFFTRSLYTLPTAYFGPYTYL